MATQSRITIEKNIKQDTDTKRYYVTFYYGKDDAGRAKRKTKTYDDLNGARIALQTHELATLKGDAIEPTRIDLNTAIQMHLDALSLKLEASTLYGYQTIQGHVKAHRLGKCPVQNVKPVDIQQYLHYLQKDKGLSSNTALKHYNFLSAVCGLLEQQEIISRNPVKRVVTPKKTKHHPEYLTADEAAATLERSKRDRMELPFALGLYTGMRRGELCGLKWDCVKIGLKIFFIDIEKSPHRNVAIFLLKSETEQPSIVCIYKSRFNNESIHIKILRQKFIRNLV